MLEALKRFFYMGGYGFYVWLSYSSVIAYLLIQWFIPWRRWFKFKQKYSTPSDPSILPYCSHVKNKPMLAGDLRGAKCPPTHRFDLPHE